MEVAAGKPFSEILSERVFGPLGMSSTEHLPPPARQGDLARVYTQDENGTLVLEPKRIAEVSDWSPGGGGLVSTAGDFMRFGLMLRNGGSLDGAKILEPETVAEMTRPHVEHGVLTEQGLVLMFPPLSLLNRPDSSWVNSGSSLIAFFNWK